MMFVRTGLMGAAALALAACGGGGGFPDAPVIDGPPANGTFSLAWAVNDTNGQVIPCDRVGAQSVTAVLRERGTQGGFTEAFTCGTGMGTANVPPGDYTINFELGAASGVLARAPEQMGVVITSNQTTALTPLTFSVDATGGLDLAITTNTVDGNCADTATGGRITTMSITLEDPADVCETVTFNVSAGAMGTAGTYVVNCGTPALVNCLHSDQRLTVSGVPSGSYQIHVRGNKAGGNNCWTNDDSFAVPPLGATLMRTLNLAFQATVPGCN